MNEGLRLLGDFYNNYETIDPKYLILMNYTKN